MGCTDSKSASTRRRTILLGGVLDWPQFIECLFDRDVPLSEIPWNDKYRTPQILRSVVERYFSTPDPPTVEKLGWFISHFALVPGGRDLATTNQVYNFITKRCFPAAKTMESARRVANAIGNIACDNKPGQRLFTTSETINFVIAALAAYRSDDSCFNFGVTLAALTDGANLDAQRFLASEDAMGAVSHALCNHATSAESVRFLCRTIANVTNGVPESRRFVSSTKFATAIAIILEKQSTTSAGSISEIASAIASICTANPPAQLLFSTSRLITAFINTFTVKATTPSSVENIGLAICRLTFENSEAIRLLATSETVNALIAALDRFAVTPGSVRYVAAAIGNIASGNPQAQRLFASRKLVSAFTIALSGYATSPESVENVGFAIGAVTGDFPAAQLLFCTPEIRAALVNALCINATTPDAVEHIGFAIGNITYNNEALQKHFSTKEVVTALAGALGKRATTADSVQYLCVAISNITFDNELGQNVFAVLEMAASLVVALSKYATTPAAARLCGLAISNICMSHSGPTLFSNPPAVAAILNALDKYATTYDSAEKLAAAINNIVGGNPGGKRAFSTQKTLSTLVSVLNKFNSTPEPSSIICRSIGHICEANREGQTLFTTPEVAKALVNSLDKCVASDECFGNVTRAICRIAFDSSDGRELFSTAGTAVAFLKHLPTYATTPESVRSVSDAISAIVVNNETGWNHFSTPTFIAAVRKMEKYRGTDSESKKEFAKFLGLLISKPAPVLLQEKGQAALALGNYREAIEHFNGAISVDPKNRDHYSNRSAAYAALNDFANARRDADLCIAKDGLWYKGYLRLGIALQGMKDLQNAIIQYERALVLAPAEAKDEAGRRVDEVKLLILDRKERELREKEQREKEQRDKEEQQRMQFGPIAHCPMSALNRGPLLGTGATSTVFEVNYHGAPAAAKLYHPHVVNDRSVQRDLAAVTHLVHPNIVQTVAAVVDDASEQKVLGLIMEKMGPNLLEAVTNANPSPSLPQILQWCVEAACGIVGAHAMRIIHSDIKPENVMLSLSNPPVAKLTDFGSAHVMSTIATKVTTARGSGINVAPEYSEGLTGPTAESDVFAFGILLWQVLHPRVNHQLGSTMPQIVRSIDRGKRPPISPQLLPELKTLIELCWHQDPASRLKMPQVIQQLRDIISRLRSSDVAKYVPSIIWTARNLLQRTCGGLVYFLTSLTWKPSPKTPTLLLSNEIRDTKHPLFEFVISKFRPTPFVRNNSQFQAEYPFSHYISRVQFVHSDTASQMFAQIHDSEGRTRASNPVLQAETFTDADSVAAMAKLQSVFEDPPTDSLNNAPNLSRILFAWHGTGANFVEAVCRDGPRSLRTTDGGFFGTGSYFALEAEYAARYAVMYGGNNNDEYSMILYAVSVSQTYPVTLERDYRRNEDPKTPKLHGFSKFYSPDGNQAVALLPKYDSHFVPTKNYHYDHPMGSYKVGNQKKTYTQVNVDLDYQACQETDPDVDGHELVIGNYLRALPIAIVYFRR